MSGRIAGIAALEARIGGGPGAIHLKVIDHLDDGARRWLSASPLLFAGFGAPGTIGTTLGGVTLGGGAPGFVAVPTPSRLRIPAASLDEPGLAREGQGFGALFLIPTIRETLRVNGRVAAAGSEAVEVAVEECYVHCAKALIRSDFWKAAPLPASPSAPADFLAASRFIALATMDSEGHADVSPKGDPAGAMIRLSGDAAWFADRPGNRRADSFRNILAQSRVAVAAVIPGASRIALISGVARITSDEAALAGFAVQGKTPLLATRIERPDIRLRHSPALARARLWPAEPPAVAIDPAAMLVAHFNLSRERSAEAARVRAAVSAPGVMQTGLEHDYKANLY